VRQCGPPAEVALFSLTPAPPAQTLASLVVSPCHSLQASPAFAALLRQVLAVGNHLNSGTAKWVQLNTIRRTTSCHCMCPEHLLWACTQCPIRAAATFGRSIVAPLASQIPCIMFCLGVHCLATCCSVA
jgi:hypothetical protein